ncbi:hypothetical protein K402DRAFT_422518 [Aulographum hederae CBS 113979]|uniref:Uncharacterized protein n=1 Tax=Aulographum hederae CBS 113979 TaxID=1176131 RepID=A0A6G1GVC5_9PEZI|nr:hypothetical protein K402DRAFT_422518 [Aulographum hederae CBS 113979]
MPGLPRLDERDTDDLSTAATRDWTRGRRADVAANVIFLLRTLDVTGALPRNIVFDASSNNSAYVKRTKGPKAVTCAAEFTVSQHGVASAWVGAWAKTAMASDAPPHICWSVVVFGSRLSLSAWLGHLICSLAEVLELQMIISPHEKDSDPWANRLVLAVCFG